MEILRSKLQAPRRQNTLHRKRLVSLFDDIVHRKLTAVIAGAGFGKTTLVVDALMTADAHTAWYRLDSQDQDFFVFMAYLYAAVQFSSGDTEADTGKRFIPHAGIKKQTACLLEWLIFVERTAAEHTVLVLDDFHLVQESRVITEAVEFILERLPNNLHLVIIGRRNLPLKLSGLRARDLLIEIDEKNLVFTNREISRFFNDSGIITESGIDEISRHTGGWAAGLVLLRYTVNKHSPDAIPDRLASSKPAPCYIFSYLKENIFDSQPPPVRDFMMKAALLPEINVRQCHKIFNVENAGTILKQMIDDHLMIFPADDTGTVFHLHHLFKDFLIDQLEKTLPEPSVQKLHREIAKAVEEHDIFLALTHYIDGRDFEEAIRVFAVHEMKFLIEGKISFLGQCLDKIPKTIIEKNPRLLLIQAKLYSNYGAPREAMELLTRAHLLFKKMDAKDEMIKCLVELGSQYYFTGHVKEAKLLMEQILDDLDPRSTTYIIAMTFLTFLPSVLGEFETAEQYYKTAGEVIETYPEFERNTSRALINTSMTHILYFKGDFEGSYNLCKKLLKTVLALRIDPCLPLVYYQLSTDCYFLGDFKKGCMFGQKGIEACEKTALADSRKGWNYLAWAQNCLGLGKLDLAMDFIDRSVELFEDPGNRWGLANAWECLHLVYLAQGKTKKARQILENALDIIKGYGLQVTRGSLENHYAGLLIMKEQHKDALDLLEQSRSRLAGAAFHLFLNHLLTVKALDRLNRPNKALEHLAAALSLSRDKPYDRYFIREKKWLVRFLTDTAFEYEAIIHERDRTYLGTLFKKELFPAHRPQVLNLYLLGPFKVSVGEKEIPVSDFKSSKALLILKYLAAHRSRRGFIPKDVLVEMLWPDEDPKKTGSRFNVAMSALRKTLEPGLPPKAPSGYIERKKDLYRLYDDRRIRVDAEQFAMAVSNTRKSDTDPRTGIPALAPAVKLYRGDFLQEDRYRDWCIKKRQAFASDYKYLLLTIVDTCERQDDLENAVLYAKKILTADPFDETGFKKLMILYGKAGDLKGITSTFRSYRDMVRQMDCPVSPGMEALYKRLT